MDDVQIMGTVAEGFEPVRDAFRRNFLEHGDVGAGVAIYVNERCVVDLTGGTWSPGGGKAFDDDTLEIVFSTTKGATAICGAMLSQRGLLDYSAPVASVWPEFARNGKESISIADVFSHRAGVPCVPDLLTLDDICDVEPIIRALENAPPVWEPGSQHGYHGLTYGWLAGELVRRVDGRSIGQFFADEVAGPLGIEFYMGVPDEQIGRVCPVIAADFEANPPASWEGDADTGLKLTRLAAAYMDPNSTTFRAMTMNGAFGVEPDGQSSWNLPKLWKAEVPGGGGVTNARSLARMYAACVGEVDGVRLLDESTLTQATKVRSSGDDAVLFVRTDFGLGFFTPSPFAPMLGDGSFGHAGSGGSVGFANNGESGARVGFGYVMNQMGHSLSDDPRPAGLIDALAKCIA